jgi:aryl-alcohol dehydrogenase-like predicted oxidoreductase
VGTDYIDVYQFHSGDDVAFDNDDPWEALRGRVAAGVIRQLGVSLGSNTNLHQVQRAGAGVIQLVYSRLDTECEAQVLPAARANNLGVLAREALAGGLPTGTYPPGTRFTDPADTRSRRPAAEIELRLIAAQDLRKTEVPRWGADGCDGLVSRQSRGHRRTPRVQIDWAARGEHHALPRVRLRAAGPDQHPQRHPG